MADVSLGVGMYIIRSAVHIMCTLMLKTIICISCVSQLTERLLPLFSHLSASSPTLQESTTAIVLKGSTGSLRGASKFLVKKVDEYAALRKGGGGDDSKGGGHGGGGDNKGSGHGGDHRK